MPTFESYGDPARGDLAALRAKHQPRAELQRAFRSAEISLMEPRFSLARWCGLDQQMLITSQETRDESGPEALARLDASIAAFQKVRDALAEQLAIAAANTQEPVELADDFKPGGRSADEDPRYLVLDVLREKHTPFVLDVALREFAAGQRAEAQDERSNDPNDTTAVSRDEWADAAEQLLDRIDRALEKRELP